MKRSLQKKAAAVLLALVMILSFSVTVLAYTVPGTTVVFVTTYGEKYHRIGCPYLLSVHSMTIREAEASGYKPCSRCHPDYLTGRYVPGIVEYFKSDKGRAAALGAAGLIAMVGAGLAVRKAADRKRIRDYEQKMIAASAEEVFVSDGEYDRMASRYGGKKRSEIAAMCGKPEWVELDSKGEPEGGVTVEMDIWYPEYKELLSKLYQLGVPVLADLKPEETDGK